MKVVLYISFIVFFTNLPQQTEQSDPILAKSHCGQVNATAFPACVKEGFSYTVISIANKYYARSYAGIIKNVMERLGDCSKYTAFMLCSLYVPRCNSSEKGPLLPCQEVCWEFVKDCGTKMDFTGLNWLKSLCSVLQNKTEKPGCFKPKDFTPSKSTFTGLSCKAKVLNENCSKSFENTIVPEKTQRNKTFQDKESEAMGRMMNSSTNEKCKTILAKLACASYTPPCNRNKMETLCRTECVYLFDNCQGAADIPGVVAYCAEPAEGYSDNGFCELNRWPSARHWETGSRTTTILPQSFPPGLIAALVLVPLFAVIFIYLAVAVRRRYRQRTSGYVQQRSTYTEPDNPTA